MARKKKKQNEVDPRIAYLLIGIAMLLGGLVHVMVKMTSETTTAGYSDSYPQEAVMGVQQGN